MSGQAEAQQAIAAMGVDIVEVLRGVYPDGNWTAGVIPFARLKRGASDVDIILPSAINGEGDDVSSTLREALAKRTGLRSRLLGLAQRVARSLDGVGVQWDWAAVRVRRLPDGGTRAAIELGRGAPPPRPLELLETPTVAPPPVSATPIAAPKPPRMPSFIPPAVPGLVHSNQMNENVGVAGIITSPSLGQAELGQTMSRAQGLLGNKQEAFSKAIMGSTGAHLIPRERAIEFSFSHNRLGRYGCDQIASFEATRGVWKWGWGNDAWVTMARAQSRKLQETGTNWRLRALAEKELKLPPESAFRLAITAAWILGADAAHFVRAEGQPEVVVAIYGVK